VMTRVEDGLPITPLPLIVPEPRLPPNADAPATPVPPAGGQPKPATDPFTAVLQQLLGKGN
jgi:penicillin-binding protein 1A